MSLAEAMGHADILREAARDLSSDVQWSDVSSAEGELPKLRATG